MKDVFIITDGGQLLYSWHSKTDRKEGESDELISGFLSALNTFATFERGEDIKSLKLKETTIIFEKNDNYFQHLVYIATTKNDNLIELIHLILHEIMDRFGANYLDVLEKEFNGEVSKFRTFDEEITRILKAYGLDSLESLVKQVKKGGNLKSITYLEPKQSRIQYIYAKQYVNKEKISFVIPLILNSARLLYNKNLNEKITWIMLNTIKNEVLLVINREMMTIVEQFHVLTDIEQKVSTINYFKNRNKYLNKPKKLIKEFEEVKWPLQLKLIYIVDLMGKIFHTKVLDTTLDYNLTDFIPEIISFLTSSKKTCEEIYNRPLFYSTIGGDNLTTICLNLDNFLIILAGAIKDLHTFEQIQDICLEIFEQL